MSTPELIDVHTHIFPSEEVSNRFLVSTGRTPKLVGTVPVLLANMRKLGISRTVMLMFMDIRTLIARDVAELPADLSPAQRKDRAEAIRGVWANKLSANNSWGYRETKAHPELMAFVGVDAAAMTEEEIRAEIAKGVRESTRGVKIVPSAMWLHPDDKRLLPAYDEAQRRGLPLLSQSGRTAALDAGGDPWGRPKYWNNVLPDFPKLRVILAHMGMGFEEEVAQLTARFPNVHADLSHRLHELDKPGAMTSQELAGWIRKIGVERLMFGTNFPLNDATACVRAFRALPLTDAEREVVGSENAKRMLGI